MCKSAGNFLLCARCPWGLHEGLTLSALDEENNEASLTAGMRLTCLGSWLSFLRQRQESHGGWGWRLQGCNKWIFENTREVLFIH